ncbi:MAG: alanine racemase [Terracidiphilus sp.]
MPSRPCWVEISTRALEDNYRFLQTAAPPGAELLAVVKADAYGHSLALCAPAAVRAGAKWLGVTSAEEGAAARALCPEARVLIMGGIFPDQGDAVIQHRLTPAVWEHWQLDELELAGRACEARPHSIPVHVEVDTGMSRQGVTLDDSASDALGSLLARFTGESPLRLEGAMTHLFAADEVDGAITDEQLRRMGAALARIAEAGHRDLWLNVGSSAVLLSSQAGEIGALASRYGMKVLIRPGLALYGVAPRFVPEEPATVAAARPQLHPVLAWKSRVTSLRSVPAGAVVGYNGTFVATEPMRLALVAAGYADGLDRSLGNRFSLLVRGERAPIAGRISMDQTVIDVTGIPGVESGDEVVILGTQGDDTITAYEHADASGTIPWEVFTRIGPRVRRISA